MDIAVGMRRGVSLSHNFCLTPTAIGPMQWFHISVLPHFRPFLSTLRLMIVNDVRTHAWPMMLKIPKSVSWQ